MEKVKIAEVCGLCAGCQNAIRTAEQKITTSEQVVLFKEIVHNPHVNDYLINLGIKTIDNLNELSPDYHVILRAHGEPIETYDYLNSNGISFSDCTCVNVKKIHELVSNYSNMGYTIIIIGKYGKTNGKPHPETTGTIGWCKTQPILIEDVFDIEKIENSHANKFYLVCQTTFNEALADEIINQTTNLCRNKNKEIVVNKSICGAQKRINEFSVNLAKNSDLMIVVGGKNSSNTKELYNNVKQYSPSIFIEDISSWQSAIEEIGFKLTKDTKVGLTAGASTQKEELFELKELIIKKQMEL